MSLSGLSLTNQRLYFAKLQLQQYMSVAGSDSEPVRQAQYESVLFHLTQAYRVFLRELVDAWNLPVSVNADSAVVLLEESSADFMSPELRELAMLEQDASSWLAKMQSAFSELVSAESDIRESGAVQYSEISITMVTDDERLSGLTLWHDSLSAVIQRLRAVSQEW